MASEQARKHEARTPRVKEEEEEEEETFPLDSNEFGFICTGVCKVGGDERHA